MIELMNSQNFKGSLVSYSRKSYGALHGSYIFDYSLVFTASSWLVMDVVLHTGMPSD